MNYSPNKKNMSLAGIFMRVYNCQQLREEPLPCCNGLAYTENKQGVIYLGLWQLQGGKPMNSMIGQLNPISNNVKKVFLYYRKKQTFICFLIIHKKNEKGTHADKNSLFVCLF